MNNSIAKIVGSDDGTYGEKRGQWNIGVVTPILMKSGVVPTINLLSILDFLGGNLYVIKVNADGNLPNLFEVEYGGQSLLLPILIAKLLKKNVILAIAASFIEIGNAKRGILSKPINFLVKINCTLTNRIILHSPNLIKEWNLEKYRNKISIAHEHSIDFNNFKIKNKIDERENLVGYIGRLSEEKGTLNFIEAIPQIIKEKDDLKFLIGGNGQLREKIEKYITEKELNDKVELTGWILHDQLPNYFNELKLIVLPSYTEGLPNIMLEAMACGTPVLATPVGAIPDVIKDGETGFIMEDNSPECIAENIIRALNHPNFEQVAKECPCPLWVKMEEDLRRKIFKII